MYEAKLKIKPLTIVKCIKKYYTFTFKMFADFLISHIKFKILNETVHYT